MKIRNKVNDASKGLVRLMIYLYLLPGYLSSSPFFRKGTNGLYNH